MSDENPENMESAEPEAAETAEGKPADDKPADDPPPDAPPPDDPPPESPPAAEQSAFELEILSEQFENYLRIAKAFLQTLKRPKDIEVGGELLSKVQKLNDSKELAIKQNNNNFFCYWLKVLKWTSENQPLDLYKFWYCDKEIADAVTESRTWLEDNKSYMALKCLKDGTYIIYAAVADDPSAGWQDGGLDILAKRGDC